MRSLRLGRFDLVLRRRPVGLAPSCCQGRGWFYTKAGGRDQVPMPAGYTGATVCPCGAAVDRIVDGARVARRIRRQVPF